MPDANWTPGPWMREDGIVYALEPCNWAGIDTFRNRVTISVQGGPETPIEEAEATARLIAAAPELFEALRGLLPDPDAGWWCRHCVAEADATYDERCTSCGEPFGEPAEEAEAVRVARAALTKAEGGTDA